ncbi:MAG: ribose ABC transporter substrate-binding protein [Aurantimonas sp.]|jgi:ribose transport system substrate-binding protein|nr:ribose ABC transporter substrate-binding protein [Aurantimonas sp.]MAQ45490.1 ribose ABC transporter substrate-binding protein [Actibacterium sp.]MAQ45515.1 ribose ABC transporter substrate-binding protein [Actibacterium sp.]MAQ45540.1 ribose ABC transporter substrate-binding protein [Actibacterium sp.]|tara:strand:- start:197 stop:1132 length:936 start_codon:yes stop_codon:yes gene_type:complete
MDKRNFLKSALFAGTAMMLAAPAMAQDDTIVIGFSQGTMNHPWRVAMVEGNQRYVDENLPNVEFIVTDGQNSSEKQVTDVETLLARGVDVLMISPLTSDALTPVVMDALDAGIPVVTMDRRVNVPVTVHVGAENRPIGQSAGEFIAEQIGGTGAVIEIQGTAGASATIDRHDGFMDAIEGTDIEVVASQHADYLRENALRFMEDQLQRFGPGEIQAVYAHNDEMALGAVQALEAAGRLDEVVVVGIDGQNSAFEAIAEGRLDASFVYPFVAPEGVQIAYQIATGESVPSEVVLEGMRVDASNIDEMLGHGF